MSSPFHHNLRRNTQRKCITNKCSSPSVYIRESFDFFNINTQEIKDENGNNLFDRNLIEDFDDILLIDRKYFRAVKSDKSNKVTTTIVYELIPQINYSTKINP